jgi:ABC-type multidrug transport system fused ATPase/permease subunit
VAAGHGRPEWVLGGAPAWAWSDDGNGKTTLTRLLVLIYDPTAGTIRWGNADVRSLQLADLRRRVGLVTQDVRVFMTTVRDNLTLFGDDILDEQILHALDDLGLMEWYRRLPHGLETWIALARVFLKDPALVILDEASSRLDPATECFIKRVLDRLTVALHLAVLEDDIAGMPQGLETVVGPRGVRLSGGQVQRTLPRIFSCAPPRCSSSMTCPARSTGRPRRCFGSGSARTAPLLG